MTTQAAENLYLAQHLLEMEGKRYAVYNPENKPLEALPVIYGFDNTGHGSWRNCYAMAEDGTVLGSHICSAEAYAPHDLGILEGTRRDRHFESYQRHYPGGYRMEFVPSAQVKTHPGLEKAYQLNQQKSMENKDA